MLIAANTRLLLPERLDGIGWFTFETLKRITRNHPEHHFLFLFDRPIPEQYIFARNIEAIRLFPPARRPFLWSWWFEHSVRKVLDTRQPDLFFSPDGFLSLSANTRSLPVIHDINFFHRPDDLPSNARKYYLRRFPEFARKARRIATVSNYSKQDISKSYGIDPDKIDVVYNGVNQIFKHLSDEEKQQTREKYSEGEEYFIFIGSFHPRKNLSNLFLAFEEFKKSAPSGTKLLIVGDAMFKTADLKRTFNRMGYKNDVVFTGWKKPEELRLVLGSAMALTYVSFFEGFGIPILEAMQCDVPVIASNITSMPEIAGDAALLTDPCSVDSIKTALQRVSTDHEFRSELINRGKIRREMFSWDKTAGKVWDSIESSLA